MSLISWSPKLDCRFLEARKQIAIRAAAVGVRWRHGSDAALGHTHVQGGEACTRRSKGREEVVHARGFHGVGGCCDLWRKREEGWIRGEREHVSGRVPDPASRGCRMSGPRVVGETI
jgi:hypothetical protein